MTLHIKTEYLLQLLYNSKGNTPTYEELTLELIVQSKSTVAYHVDLLKEDGLIVSADDSRNLLVTEKGVQYLGANKLI